MPEKPEHDLATLLREVAMLPAIHWRWLILGLKRRVQRVIAEYWHGWAHDGQSPDGTDWKIWLLLAGRGFGKTRAGAEWISDLARKDGSLRLALVGATVDDVRRVMIEGQSGLLAVARRDENPKWLKSSGQVHFDSGAIAYCYAASNPEMLRGPEHHHCPAYRDIAYAVFEGLQLADYGNRIPSLTFEIVERDGSVRLVDITGTASGGLIVGESEEVVSGYALSGDSVRASIAPLLDAMPCLARGHGELLEIVDWSADGTAISVTEAAKSGSERLTRVGQELRAANSTPQSLVVRHYEPQRDYQLGSQHARRASNGGVERQIDLPASVDAASALRFADLQLLQAQTGRASLSGYFANSSAATTPGDWVQYGEDAQPWRVTEIEYLRGARKISAKRFLHGDVVVAAASPGRSAENPDFAIGETRFIAIDLPPLGATDPGAVTIGVFANGTEPGWRRAALSIQNGEQLLDAGATAAPAKIGWAESALPQHPPLLVDTRNSVTIQMLRADIALHAGEGSPLDANAPLCWLKGEFIRYGSAEHLGGGRYRLAGLLRGCFGSENHIADHTAGDDFVLVEAESAKMLDAGGLMPGSSLTLTAEGIGDDAPVPQSFEIQGNAIRPLAPVHLRRSLTEADGLSVRWIRRSRLNSGWQDGVDVPLGEERESYLVELSTTDFVLGSWTTSANEFGLPPEVVATWPLETGDILQIAIRQIGRFAHSAAAITDAVYP